jgi:hypothetical protein
VIDTEDSARAAPPNWGPDFSWMAPPAPSVVLECRFSIVSMTCAQLAPLCIAMFEDPSLSSLCALLSLLALALYGERQSG